MQTVQMLTFVGPALELPQISDPTPEEVGRVRRVNISVADHVKII